MRGKTSLKKPSTLSFFFFFCQESLQAEVNDWNSLQAAVNDPRGVCVCGTYLFAFKRDLGVDVNTLMGFMAETKVGYHFDPVGRKLKSHH